MVRTIDGIQTRQQARRNAKIYSTGKNATWLVILIVACVTVGASYFYYQTLLEPEAVPSQISNTAAPSTESTEETNSVLTNSIVTVTVYDSGAGEQATKAALTKLEEAGFSAQNLAQSQLTYDKTYLWYRPEFIDEAKRIQSTLTDREVVIAPTQIIGSFDLLLYLGKK